jgi:hypothetical protein
VAADVSAPRNEQDLEPVRIRECLGELLPERIGWSDLRLADPLYDRSDLRRGFEIEDEHRFGMGIRRRMLSSGCEFELALSSGNLEKGAVIAIVVLKRTGLIQTDQIAVEGDDLLEPVGVSSDSNLHFEAQTMPEYRLSSMPTRSLSSRIALALPFFLAKSRILHFNGWSYEDHGVSLRPVR